MTPEQAAVTASAENSQSPVRLRAGNRSALADGHRAMADQGGPGSMPLTSCSHYAAELLKLWAQLGSNQ